ncbi:CBS domain-containing protein [Flagellimonas sp. S174]|uniref:CBS domain-containing protein n=1 Tax=Flagellimonas sp. S174 TaxID=3410790 RepID=UPI00262CED2C|nr:CBS domain-containing protein [uncultured Allomuricauda sp.]
MQIQDKIISSIPVFEVSETLKDVILFFEESAFSHVAVTENGEYLGVLSENDLPCFEPDETIGKFRFEMERFHVKKETMWMDVLETFSRNEANVIPVIDDNEMVAGYYNLEEVVDYFIDTPFFREAGSILVVSIGSKDYSFSEIAQIVESNNARLLGAFISESLNDILYITLKIASENLNEVAQTFRRYNYTIEFGNSDDKFIEDLKERSDYLEKYLNI